MTEGLPKKSLGLPAPVVAEEEVSTKKSLLKKKEPKEKVEKILKEKVEKSPKDAKEKKEKKPGLSFGKAKADKPLKPAKGDKKDKGSEDKDAPEQKSLLKMSPAEIKEYFGNRKGNSEPIVPIEDMVFIPKKPEVNLLPQDILDGYTAHDLKIKFAKIGGAVVFTFLVLFGLSTLSHNLSQGEIEKLSQEAVDANIQIRGLQPYEMYKSTVEEKRTALSGEMQKNLNVGGIMDSLTQVGSNSGITFTKIALDSASTECTSPDPFNTVSTIGCLTFSAEGSGADSVVKFYDSTKGVSGFVNAYIPGDSAVAKEGKSTIEGSIGITEEFYASTGSDELSTPIDTILEANAAQEAAQTKEPVNGE